MIGDTNNVTNYSVDYKVWLDDGEQVALSHRKSIKVDLYWGHSDLGSIPAIISTATGVPARDILVVSVDANAIVRNGVRY